MRRFCVLLASVALWNAPSVRAQDAATEERLNQLAGRIEVLLEGQQALKRQMDALSREISEVREQAARPNTSYATQDEVKRLADAINQLDRKRIDDNERVQEQLQKMIKVLDAPLPALPKRHVSSPADSGETAKPARPEKGFEYTVKSGDALSAIVAAYQKEGVKVTMEQVLKANPGLKQEKIRVGQKIWIPAPQKD